MSQSRRFDPQPEEPFSARPGRSPNTFGDADSITVLWAQWFEGRRGRWRSWRSIIRLLPVAGRVTIAAILLNLVIGMLPLGFVIGTSVAIGRVAGAARGTWGGAAVLLAVGLAVIALLLQSVLSPFQAVFTELISRRADGACARRLMRAASPWACG